MTGGETQLPEDPRRDAAVRTCFVLLAACVPASMLALVLLPRAAITYLRAHAPALFAFYAGIAARDPSWSEYFAVQTLAAALAVCCVWALLSRRSPHRLRGAHIFALLVGAIAAWSAASYIWSVWPYATRAWFIRELPFWFLAATASLICGTERRWLTFARVFLAAVVLQAAVTALVLLLDAHGHLRSLPGAFLAQPLFYQNKNYCCAVMLTGAYLAVGLTLRRAFAADRERMPVMLVIGALAALALTGFVFAVAGALAGWVALFVSAPAYALCALPVRRRGLVAALAAGVMLAVCVIVLAAGGLRQRAVAWATNPKSTANVRVTNWTAGLRAFAARPVEGWGVGTWPAIFPTFQPPLASAMPQTATTRPDHPHNEFVRVAANLGIVGVALYAAILLWSFAVSYRALRDQPAETRLVGYALWAGALAFFVQTLFGKAPTNWTFSANYWILLGVLASSAWWGERQAEKAPERGGRMPAYGWAVLALVAAAAAYGWWQWGVGGYRSMVELRVAEEANQWLAGHPDEPGGRPEVLRQSTDMARARSLDPAAIIYYDYLIGGTMVREGRWQDGARYLEEHVERWAPGMLESDLLLADCYARTGRPREAAEHAERYVLEDPYKLKGYDVLGRFDPARAAELLHEQVYVREGLGEPNAVMLLLEFDVKLGDWDVVSKTVQDAARANKVTPETVVQMLAGWLRDQGEKAALSALEAHYPGAFSARNKGRSEHEHE
jgi:O-antigen ligase